VWGDAGRLWIGRIGVTDDGQDITGDQVGSGDGS